MNPTPFVFMLSHIYKLLLVCTSFCFSYFYFYLVIYLQHLSVGSPACTPLHSFGNQGLLFSTLYLKLHYIHATVFCAFLSCGCWLKLLENISLCIRVGFSNPSFCYFFLYFKKFIYMSMWALFSLPFMWIQFLSYIYTPFGCSEFWGRYDKILNSNLSLSLSLSVIFASKVWQIYLNQAIPLNLNWAKKSLW